MVMFPCSYTNDYLIWFHRISLYGWIVLIPLIHISFLFHPYSFWGILFFFCNSKILIEFDILQLLLLSISVFQSNVESLQPSLRIVSITGLFDPNCCDCNSILFELLLHIYWTLFILSLPVLKDETWMFCFPLQQYRLVPFLDSF